MENKDFNYNVPEEAHDKYPKIEVPNQKPFFSYFIIGVNIVVWLLTVLYDWKTKTQNGNFIFGEKFNPLIMDGQFWRLLTPVFLHGNIIHLFVNSYSIYAIGPTVEKMFGTKKTVAIYFAAGITGSITSFIFSTAPSVGASGAIFGLLGALLYMGQKNKSIFKGSFGTAIIGTIIINIAYGFSHSGIDNFAHLGGLVGGYLAAASVGLFWEKTFTRGRILVMGLIVALSLGGVFAGFKVPSNIQSRDTYHIGQKAEALIKEISNNFDNKQFQKSEELSREILSLGNIDKNTKMFAYDTLTASLINQGKAEQGVEYAKILVSLYPERGHYLLGMCYYNLKEITLAKEEFTKAIELDPQNTQAKEILDSLK